MGAVSLTMHQCSESSWIWYKFIWVGESFSSKSRSPPPWADLLPWSKIHIRRTVVWTSCGGQFLPPAPPDLLLIGNSHLSFIGSILTRYCGYVVVNMYRGFLCSVGRWCASCILLFFLTNPILGVCPKLVHWHHHFTHWDPMIHTVSIFCLLLDLISIQGGRGPIFIVYGVFTPPWTDLLTC